MDLGSDEEPKHAHNNTQVNRAAQAPSSPNKRATPYRIKKRARVQTVSSRPLSVARLIESMDKTGLESLISTLCYNHPELTHEVAGLAPKVSINSALVTLNKKLDAVFLALPYKGDQQGDYAYLRVKSLLEDLLATMSDYIAHFLPPNEPQISNTLAFLDGATSLLHKVPVWSNPGNNYLKNAMYDEVAQAWTLALAEAAQMSNGLGLAFRMWEQKLEQHDDLANNRLGQALTYMRQAMTWREPDSAVVSSSASPLHGLTHSSFTPSTFGVKWNHS